MGPMEYRIERVGISSDRGAKSFDAQFVDQINVWARDGWRVANVLLSPGPGFASAAGKVLLEREAGSERARDTRVA